MKKLKRILLVDDDETTNFVHRYLLQKSGISESIAEVLHGAEAIDYLKTAEGAEVDLIFLDVNMPVMNGFEFLEAYENSDEVFMESRLILMLTSSIHPEDRKRASSFSSLVGYYEKPLSEQVLKEIQAKYL